MNTSPAPQFFFFFALAKNLKSFTGRYDWLTSEIVAIGAGSGRPT